MALDRIDSIANIPALQQEFETIEQGLQGLSTQLAGINSKAIKIELKLGDAKNLIEFNTLMKELGSVSKEVTTNLNKQAEAHKENAAAILTEKQVELEEIKIKRENLKLSQEVERQQKREEKQVETLTSEYKQLSQLLDVMRLKTKDLIIAKGEDDAITKAMIADTQALDARLKGIDATLGQHTRSVGNYNMVGAQFNQLLRELSNVGISLRTTILAMSNNLGYFAESVVASLKSGNSWKDVLKSMTQGGNLLVLAINAGVAALTFFGTRLFSTTEEAKKTKSAIDELASSFDKLVKEELKYREGLRNTAGTGTKALERELNLLKARGATATEIYQKEQELNAKRKQDVADEIKIYEGLSSFINTNAKKDSAEWAEAMSSLPSSTREALVKAVEIAKENGTDISAVIIAAGERLQQELLDAQNKTDVTRETFIKSQMDKAKKASEKSLKEQKEAIEELKKLDAILFNYAKDVYKENAEAVAKTNKKLHHDALKFLKEREEKEIEANKKIHDARVQRFEDAKKLHDKERQEYINTIQSLNQIANAFLSLSQIQRNASNERVKNLGVQRDLIAENYQYEIDKIRESALSQEEKERRTQELAADTASKQADIRAKEREERRRQAAFDKATAIMQIIVNTAAAVAIALKDPVSPLIKALAVGAQGAAQLAIAASAPLPQYAEGGETQGGNFIAGEAGKELIVTPDGRAYMTPDKATVYNEPRGTKVFNQDQLNALFGGLVNGGLYKMLNSATPNKDLSKSITEAIKDGTEKTVRAINKNRAIQNVNVVNGNDAYYQQSVKRKYW